MRRPGRERLRAPHTGFSRQNKTVGKRPAMLYVMLYDHIFGRGIRGGGAVKRVIKDNQVSGAARRIAPQ